MTDSPPAATTTPTTSSRSAKWKIVGLVVAVVGLGPAFRFLPIAQGLADFLEDVRGVGVWGPAVLAAVYVLATVLMAPGSILTLGADYAFGVVWGTVAVSEGSVVGATLAFLVGRYAARDFVGALAERHPARFCAEWLS